MIKFPEKKITFESFPCGMPSRDYMNQDISYEEQIKNAGKIYEE